jgi:L-seryl-tRNA(Ser) seleniumtransferase
VHTDLGRALLSAAARDAVLAVAGCADVEFDLTAGKRARRGAGALNALARAVPAAGAVHIVNNNAAALVLGATALAAGREIIVSRGELIEIGDGFRLPDLLQSTGARICEVGTTNRTSLEDYRLAIGPDTAFILKVHPSNYVIDGFTSSVGVGELADLGVLVVGDIGSGLLRPSPLLPAEPDADSWLRAGAALVTASGDKLLGGPQAGLLLGAPDIVTRLARHPMARALRVDKLTLAALEATLTGPAPPVTEALNASPVSIMARARALAARLRADGLDCLAVPTIAAVGGGGAPGVSLPSAAISLPEHLGAALRSGGAVRSGVTPAVTGRMEDGRLLLDLRAVAPADDDRLVAAVLAATGDSGSEPTGE